MIGGEPEERPPETAASHAAVGLDQRARAAESGRHRVQGGPAGPVLGNLAGYQQHINRMAELIRQALAQSANQGDGAGGPTTTAPPTTAPPG